MTAIEIKINDSEIIALFERIDAHLSDMTPVWREVGEIVHASVRRNFRAGGRPEKWKPSKRVKRKGGQTLRDTSRLSNSMTVDAGKNSVKVGTNVEYAPTHHFGAKKGSFGVFVVKVKAHSRQLKSGKATANVMEHIRRTTVPWGKIPARPFLMVQDEDWAEIKRKINEFITTDRT